jgi:hypothetical protein
MRWAYGVTTVPERAENLLPKTLASLVAAGFDKPRLFIDGSEELRLYRQFNLECTFRFPKVRAYGNWIMGVWELFLRDPKAERYAMFQDDLITYPNLRQYLDACTYEDNTYWNLFTLRSNEPSFLKERGLPYPDKSHIGFYNSNQRGRGAVALVFSRQALMTLLNHQHMIDRINDTQRGHRAIDGGVVEAMTKAGYRELVHSPSLVKHIGEESIIGSTDPDHMKQKPINLWNGDKFDAASLIGISKSVIRSKQL